MTNIDWTACPIVQINPARLSGVPTLRDLRLSADTIVENHDDDLSDEEIAEIFEVPIEDVRTIIAYAEQARISAHPV